MPDKAGENPSALFDYSQVRDPYFIRVVNQAHVRYAYLVLFHIMLAEALLR